ncbi:MAG: hypothetical protein Q8M26_14270 [Pseudolabrys sp.]|nr:hypothetical protein [Pseudolabrys sp.]
MKLMLLFLLLGAMLMMAHFDAPVRMRRLRRLAPSGRNGKTRFPAPN